MERALSAITNLRDHLMKFNSNGSEIIEKNNKREIDVVMNIENWFQNPNIFNFAMLPQGIMQNQDAMSKGCMNGKMDVFSAMVD